MRFAENWVFKLVYMSVTHTRQLVVFAFCQFIRLSVISHFGVLYLVCKHVGLGWLFVTSTNRLFLLLQLDVLW